MISPLSLAPSNPCQGLSESYEGTRSFRIAEPVKGALSDRLRRLLSVRPLKLRRPIPTQSPRIPSREQPRKWSAREGEFQNLRCSYSRFQSLDFDHKKNSKSHPRPLWTTYQCEICPDSRWKLSESREGQRPAEETQHEKRQKHPKTDPHPATPAARLYSCHGQSPERCRTSLVE
jgi:hypothetical protein